MSFDNKGSQWKYTERAIDVAKAVKTMYEERGLRTDEQVLNWMGRRLIGRDSPINGGAYLCAGEGGQILGEACVVDDQKMPVLRDCYADLRARAEVTRQQRGLPLNQVVLNEVFKLTEEKIPYKEEVAQKIMGNETSGRKIGLDMYMEKGGVCRHQALLMGYLIEKLIQDRVLSGKVSVDRNFMPNQGGHAWVRYTTSRGNVYILDTAQDFCGSLEEAKKLRGGWDYRRSGE